jgi:predicted glutamine amidotransferase
MSRMFGLIGNRADLGARVLEAHRELLRVERPKGEALGWGIGFHQFGEVLLRRRPVDEREVIDLVESTERVRSDVLIGHVRRATVGALRTENTHPFRYRGWLYADTGTVPGFDALRERLLDSLPEFLRRNVRGDTDSELVFYLFLGFLHDAGQLRDGDVEPEAVRDALRSALTLVDRLSAEEGHPGNLGDVLVTDGERLYAVHRAGGMVYRQLQSAADLDALSVPPSGPGEHRRSPSLDGAQFSLVVTQVEPTPERFVVAPLRNVLTLSHDDAPTVEAL